MTRATLLHALDRPTALGPAEVRELEQLAQAFPYCQTAHLLLAKAAHDQGTMLAGQRLRRAATYAADRTLLRRLIEMVEPAPTEAPAPQPEAAPEAVLAETPAVIGVPALPETVAVAVPAGAPEPVLAVAPVAMPIVPVAVAPAPEVAPVAEAVPPTPAVEILPEVAAPIVAVSLPVPAVAEPVTAEPEITAANVEIPVELPMEVQLDIIQVAEFVPEIVPEPISIEALLSPIAEPTPQATYSAPTETTQAEAVEVANLIDQEGASIPTLAEEAAPNNTSVSEPVEEEADLPAQAPAIRPPVEVGEARFEFGLAESPPLVLPTYELPGLVDEWAAAAVTLSMGSPTALLPETSELGAPAFTPAAFTGDSAVGYSFGESSRLGLSMQLLDLLAAQAEAAEIATAVVAAAQPPAVALPPTGTFFEPDPLLLDHWVTHCPPPPMLPSSLDLINNFLKRQPRLTRPAMLPPSTGGQADLSARSTRAEPDLVSENLARIFVRQGKNIRAIEIYEKLMVKHPEKLAYFAAQIQSLQPSA